MKVVVCVKQIPDPASDYTLEPDSHWLVRPAEQVLDDTDRYGVEMGLQLAQASDDRTVTLVSMGPTGNMQGIRQALAMGADKAVVVDDADLRGLRRPHHRPGARGGHPTRRLRPRHRRDRVDRRLLRCRSADDRRTPRCARPHLCHVRRDRRRRDDPPPDRSGYDTVEAVAAGAGVGDRRRRRAPLPDLQGDHGRQEEAGGHDHGRRSRRRPARSTRRSPSHTAPERSAGTKIETTARPPRHRRQAARIEGDLNGEHLGLRPGTGRRTHHARPRAPHQGPRASVTSPPSTWVRVRRAFATLGEYGAAKVFHFDPGDALSRTGGGRPRRSRGRPTQPDLILFGQAYDDRDVAGRLAARIGRSVLSNAVDVTRRRRRPPPTRSSAAPNSRRRRSPAIDPSGDRPSQVVRSRAVRRWGTRR
jgi:hypothetical protein